MTTLAQLADAIQANHLDDAAVAFFTQNQVEAWILEAIKDFSKYLPRRLTDTITTTADDFKYDLEADFIAALSVEYPTGETPPAYLKRRPYTHRDFWSEDGYYDILEREDDTNTAEIWISTNPATSGTITIEYKAFHDYVLASGDTITVPAEHFHTLTLFVLWKASEELQMHEEEDPTSNSSLLMSMLAQNGGQFYRQYLNAVAELERKRSGRSQAVVWPLDDFDQERIY